MPRGRRVSPDNFVQHVLNRGNRKQTIFWKPADYEHFIGLMADTLERVAMRILAFCLMPNHFHLVVWPEVGSALPAYMQRLEGRHASNHHRHYGTTGQGHIYQDRYHNFIVQDGLYVYRVLRYVEANALSAGLVQRAEDWPWSSVAMRETRDGRSLLAEWPLPKPANWVDYVNSGVPVTELEALRAAAHRDAPFGADGWVQEVAARYNLTATLNPPHRPKGETIAVPDAAYL